MNRRDSHGRLRVHEGREFTQPDMLVPFQNADGSRFLRYLTTFPPQFFIFLDETENEIESLHGNNGINESLIK